MEAKTLTGVFPTQKKNGELHYRSSITYKAKHISLGSYSDATKAHLAYLEADRILHTDNSTLPSDYSSCSLSFEKWISLLNFRNNGIYFKNPIYLMSGYFLYYLSPSNSLIFDIDDLFYYSSHKIMFRNRHFFVADYGMQVSILSRYGVRSYSVPGRDYRFINGNQNDFRYENIEIINPYFGVSRKMNKNRTYFQAKIHVVGDYIIGRYSSAENAAIAYNKAIDVLKKAGSPKNYQPNYIENISGKEYAERYSRLKISDKLYHLSFLP